MKGVFSMEEKFIEFMKNQRLSENTYKSYASDIKIYKQYYFDSYGEELVQLIHGDIAMYSSYLYKNNTSSKTINRKMAALKQYNLFLISEGIQQDVVILDKDYIKIQNSMIAKTIPSIQEINKLIHYACKDEKNAKRDRCFMILFIYAGLRESELVTIRLVDIHLENRFINIVGKGNKFRQVVINKFMYDALEEYLQDRNEMDIKSPYLFVGQKTKNNGGKPFNRNFCNRLLDKYKEICKIEKLHPHLLRAFYCSNALHNAGYSIDQVANQAGHSSLNTTKGYLVTSQEDLLTLSNKL